MLVDVRLLPLTFPGGRLGTERKRGRNIRKKKLSSKIEVMPIKVGHHAQESYS